MAAERQNTVKQVYEDPRTGFGNLAETLKLARQRDPNITREDVKKFLDGLITQEDRPQRGYNSYVLLPASFATPRTAEAITLFWQGVLEVGLSCGSDPC